MPGGANGMWLKLLSPSNMAYADMLVFSCEILIRLIVSSAWRRSSFHNCIGKNLLTVHKPAMKWFLKVCMARSAAFTQCMCGSKN